MSKLAFLFKRFSSALNYYRYFKVVINAAEVKLTGKKLTDKKYTWHTGYPGGLKQINVKRQLEKKPEEVRTVEDSNFTTLDLDM